MTVLLSVKVTSPTGTEYTLSDTASGWWYADAEGVGLDGVQIVSARTPYRHGETARGVCMTSRQVALMFYLVKDSASELASAIATRQSQLIPDSEASLYTIAVQRADGVWRALDGLFTRIAVKPLSPTTAQVTFHFTAPEPFWYDPDEQEDGASLEAGAGFSFPLTFPASFESTSIDKRLNVQNAGDVDTWPTFVITGPCDNPVLENETTAKTLSLTHDMDAGDYITVDMENATVRWYDASAGTEYDILEALSADSEFWPLVRGENVIHVVASGASGGSITAAWYNRYAAL